MPKHSAEEVRIVIDDSHRDKLSIVIEHPYLAMCGMKVEDNTVKSGGTADACVQTYNRRDIKLGDSGTGIELDTEVSVAVDELIGTWEQYNIDSSTIKHIDIGNLDSIEEVNIPIVNSHGHTQNADRKSKKNGGKSKSKLMRDDQEGLRFFRGCGCDDVQCVGVAKMDVSHRKCSIEVASMTGSKTDVAESFHANGRQRSVHVMRLQEAKLQEWAHNLTAAIAYLIGEAAFMSAAEAIDLACASGLPKH